MRGWAIVIQCFLEEVVHGPLGETRQMPGLCKGGAPVDAWAGIAVQRKWRTWFAVHRRWRPWIAVHRKWRPWMSVHHKCLGLALIGNDGTTAGAVMRAAMN